MIVYMVISSTFNFPRGDLIKNKKKYIYMLSDAAFLYNVFVYNIM